VNRDPTREPSQRRRRCWAPFHGIIDAILAADEQAPPKQRHTASQVSRRLRDEHPYRGSYDQVRRYVGQHRRDRRETFIPLAHDPGQRLEKRPSATSMSIFRRVANKFRC
jgi:hypothetical protein